MKTLIVVLCLLAVSCTAAKPTPPWYASIQKDPKIQMKAAITFTPFEQEPPFTREQAFFMVLNAPGFYPLEFGEGDSIDVTTVAFTTLLSQPDARDVFLDLTKRATIAGKLYGLCGLYLVDRSSFDQAVTPFIMSTESVMIPYGGCVVGPRPVSQVVRSADAADICHGRFPENLPRLSRGYVARQKRQAVANQPAT